MWVITSLILTNNVLHDLGKFVDPEFLFLTFKANWGRDLSTFNSSEHKYLQSVQQRKCSIPGTFLQSECKTLDIKDKSHVKWYNR